MERKRKITVEVPAELLKQAQQFTGKGVTPMVTEALKRLAASNVYRQLLELRGKVAFGRTWQELKSDR